MITTVIITLGNWSIPDVGMEKEHRGHVTLLCSPGSGRMLPHSGQKFGSPPKHDISKRKSVS